MFVQQHCITVNDTVWSIQLASLKTKKASIAIDDDKIELKNELYNLKTLILNLTAAIKTSAYVDNPAAPTVVVQPHQSFITLITQFEQHLAILLK